MLTISERIGMLKTYELMDRHFGWERRPRPATERAIRSYLLDRALRSQGIVSLDSDLLSGRPGASRAHAAADREPGAPQGAGAGRARGSGKAGALGAPGGARGHPERPTAPEKWSISCRRSIR